ncbi:MAG: QueT transporter family protein [Parasporobacterium sp.]|nr:QueT transporter family protein [Parasporobacterium sp.]
MSSKKTLFITQGALIAALYIVLTYIANAIGLASGVIQFRISEMLTVLPFFLPAAIPGVTIGCLLANILTGCIFYDVLFGTLATLFGAIGTWLIGKAAKKASSEKSRIFRFISPVPPILSNTLIVPWVLRIFYEMPDNIWYLSLTVFIGEAVCCGILGLILLHILLSRKGSGILK